MEDHLTMDEDSWAMFGRPIFDDPAAKSLARVGVVDVGSNSVRLVIFDGAARSPAYFFNEKVLCGLGAGMAETGHLNPDGRQRALAALRRFQAIAKGMGIAPLMAVATAAVREAKDGPAFREEIERETGLRLEVIDGREEARLSAQGVLLGWPEADGLVCDIGGSSMELALVQNGEIGWRETSPLGPLELAKLQGDEGTLNDWITSHLRAMREDLPNPPKRMYLVGGSWRAVARLDMVRRSYPLKVLHEYRISPEGLAETLDLVERSDPTELRKRAGVSGDRMALIPLASRVLAGLSKVLAPEEFYISSYGLREGLLYESMPKDLRARDPLIEACLHAEARNARVPGFGRILYEFLRPLYRDSSPEELRIIKAACLLHDVSWRTHPDYRAEVCFDYATRANLGGLTHSERVFLGLALMHRYKNSRGGRAKSLLSLIDEAAEKKAEILGKAMRFGAMFSAESHPDMGLLELDLEKETLSLHLSSSSAELFGEVALGRFQSLARALSLSPMVVQQS